MEPGKKVKVKATLMWAFLDTVNQKSEKYSVDLCNLSKEAVKALTDIGIQVKKKEDQPEKGFYVVAKSKNYPIKTVDMEGKPITGIKVANGSKGVALVSTYLHKSVDRFGMGVGIDKLVITDLKIYESDVVDVDDDEDVL